MVMLKKIKNNRGYLRIIEMAFAAALVIGFIIYMQQMQSASFRNPPNYDPLILKIMGQDVLRTLDLRDNESNYIADLRQHLSCDATTWGNLISDIREHLPENIGFSIYSVDLSGGSTYKGGISEPLRSEIVTVNYIVAGEYGNYSNFDKPCSIKLVLWFNQ